MPCMVQTEVVLAYDRYDRYARLDRQMESALLERSKIDLLLVRSRALGEYPYRRPLRFHLLASGSYCLHGARIIASIYEDGS